MKSDTSKNTSGSIKERIKRFMQTPQSIRKTCAILSLYTVIVFNIPAFRIVLDNIECN